MNRQDGDDPATVYQRPPAVYLVWRDALELAGVYATPDLAERAAEELRTAHPADVGDHSRRIEVQEVEPRTTLQATEGGRNAGLEYELFDAALAVLARSVKPHLGDWVVAAVAVACWLDGPDPSRPHRSFTEQLMDAVPGEVYDQWLPVDYLHRMERVEPALRGIAARPVT